MSVRGGSEIQLSIFQPRLSAVSHCILAIKWELGTCDFKFLNPGYIWGRDVSPLVAAAVVLWLEILQALLEFAGVWSMACPLWQQHGCHSGHTTDHPDCCHSELTIDQWYTRPWQQQGQVSMVCLLWPQHRPCYQRLYMRPWIVQLPPMIRVKKPWPDPGGIL